jgi:hypothetical protein
MGIGRWPRHYNGNNGGISHQNMKIKVFNQPEKNMTR